MGPGQQAQRLGERQAAAATVDSDPDRRPEPGQSAPEVIRRRSASTAGRGRMSMPPVERTEDYLDLISGVEAAAADLALRSLSRERSRRAIPA